jgi:inner membrane protein
VATILTHAVVGAALAPLAPSDVSRRRAAFALAVVAVFPDLDVIGFRLGIPYAHPLGHRGFSHSLLFAALLSAVIARFGFETARRWRAFFVLFAATASHAALDAFTDGGLGVGFWIPFSNARYFAPVRPLPVSPIGIDGSVVGILRVEFFYVWLPVFGLLAASAIWRRARTRARAPRSRAASS